MTASGGEASARGAGGVPAAAGALLGAVGWLDGRLAAAARSAEALFAVPAGGDPYRGLYVDAAAVERLLGREAGRPAFALDDPLAGIDEALGRAPRLAALAAEHGLEPFDVAVLLIALAPELDLRYERLYGYLHDDVTRRRPTVALALDLLCASATERLDRRQRFTTAGPLVRSRLVRVSPETQDGIPPPLLAHALRPDPRVIARLLGEPGLDGRLAAVGAELAVPAPVARPPELEGMMLGALAERAAAARGAGRALVIYLEGRPGSGRASTARAIAGALGSPLLELDLARLAAREEETDELVRLLLDEASARGALALLRGLDVALADGRERCLDALLRAVAAHDGVSAITGTRPWPPASELVPLAVRVEPPPPGRRREHWRSALGAHGLRLSAAEVDALGDRFRLTPGQIARAAADAAVHAGGETSAAEVFAAARRGSRGGLGRLARRVESRLRWEHLVLPEDRLAQLREAAAYLRHGARVFEDWGFARRLDCAQGLSMLFAGPSGSGKTTAAKVLAGELGLELYKVDLSAVVDKYIGETEKNLARVFDAAEAGNAILFFDEADALFGKRSEVRDSHDRYANLETSFLLQRMEEYEGLAILATNLAKHLDEAFARRIQITIEFPLPGPAERGTIWRGIWPPALELGADVDLELLAAAFELSGGSIRNAALGAAFLAAEDGGPVEQRHLLAATRSEYRKLGNVTLPRELVAPTNGAAR